MKISEKKTVSKYTLYVGLNDKDTHEQRLIMDRVVSLVIWASNGYKSPITGQSGFGTYYSESGEQVNEKSIVITLVDVSEELAHEIAADLCAFLNQSEVMITRENV